MEKNKNFVNSLFEQRWLGRQSYEEGLHYQEKLIAQKVAGDANNYLLLLEHEPVYTMGRTQDTSSLGTEVLPHPLHRIGRGGQATYHGPGQLVCYPIIDLHLLGCDLHRYLRLLEEVIIKTLQHYSIVGERKEGMTGVWVKGRKIASLGVGVRKWMSLHGLALNVCCDLSPFKKITPCGLQDVEMTSLEQELLRANKDSVVPSVEEVAERLGAIFVAMMNA